MSINQITLISTVHKENGKCSAEALCSILTNLKPDVIFLEALADTYSIYDQNRFEQFGVSHSKLEIAAIQRLSQDQDFTYVPVLDRELGDRFNKKMSLLGSSNEHRNQNELFNQKASIHGFDFLNSEASIDLQNNLRQLEKELLMGNKIEEEFKADIDAYENNMLENIHSYCSTNSFNIAVFMCGVAHRKSIIDKISVLKKQKKDSPTWNYYGA